MWQADEGQRTRIQKLVGGFVEEIPLYWAIPKLQDAEADKALLALLWETKPCDPAAGNIAYSGWLRHTPMLSEHARRNLIERLEARFGIAFLDQVMPEFLMYPDEHHLPKYWLDGSEALRRIAQFTRAIANEWVIARGDNHAAGLVAERLKHLLLHSAEDPEILQPELREARQIWSEDSKVFFHHVGGCIKLLVQLHQQPEALIAIKQLVTGAWNFPLAVPETSGHPVSKTTAYQTYNSWLCRPFYNDPKTTNAILESLCTAGHIDYQSFVLIYQNPHYFMLSPITALSPRGVAGLSPAWQTLYGYAQQLIWALAQRLPKLEQSDVSKLNSYNIRYYGSRWLLLACEYVESLQLPRLITEGKESLAIDNNLVHLIKNMAGILGLADGDNPEQIVSALRRFKQQTLLVVAPHAGVGKKFILQALDWADLLPLLDWTDKTHRQFVEENTDMGVIDRPALLSLLTTLTADRVGVFMETGMGGFNATFVLATVTGQNREQLRKSLKKESQLAMKAYGLLPLEAGEQILDCYLMFKNIAKDCAKYGAERQTNTRAAVQIGLANFAQTAGFADLTRLEWAMEAKITDEGVPLGQRETIGDWQVELCLEGLIPQIVSYKQDKPLKSVPAGLRKLERFLAFKETQTRIKDQVPRFRAALENMMVEDEAITLDDLQNLVKLPIMGRLLQSLILRTHTGDYGFFDPESLYLLGLGGAKIKLDGEVKIPHAYHFFQDGVLPNWQREVVRKRIVQPFKQAYRELYVLTPAEAQTAVYSDRFAGHVLQPMTANGLLRKRGWKSDGSEPIVFRKYFRKQGLTAEFAFPDADEEFPRSESVTSDQLRFLRQNQAVPLLDVPPLIFSEVMRDADLVVSVAQLNDKDGHWSIESYQRRAELVTALCDDFGLAAVRCTGHFAYIQGKRASYRVHLGSAAIHIEPGNYLCVVPAKPEGEKDQFFLPFADTDSKTSEVISKILMLANDGQIKDPSIVRQIEAAGK